MLVIVVILFAVCWLPLNTYHLVVDFSPLVGSSRHSSTVFFVCHWLAMSSVCYNPFIYCWLNDHFRAGARAWLWCAAKKLSRLFCHETRRGSRDDDAEFNNIGLYTTQALTDQNTNQDALSSSSSAITCVPLSIGKKTGLSRKSSRQNSRTFNAKASIPLRDFNKTNISSQHNNNTELKLINPANQIHIPLTELIPLESSKSNANKKAKSSYFKIKLKKKKPQTTSFSSSTCSSSSTKKFGHSSSSGSYHSYSSQPINSFTKPELPITRASVYSKQIYNNNSKDFIKNQSLLHNCYYKRPTRWEIIQIVYPKKHSTTAPTLHSSLMCLSGNNTLNALFSQCDNRDQLKHRVRFSRKYISSQKLRFEATASDDSSLHHRVDSGRTHFQMNKSETVRFQLSDSNINSLEHRRRRHSVPTKYSRNKKLHRHSRRYKTSSSAITRRSNAFKLKHSIGGRTLEQQQRYMSVSAPLLDIR